MPLGSPKRELKLWGVIDKGQYRLTDIQYTEPSRNQPLEIRMPDIVEVELRIADINLLKRRGGRVRGKIKARGCGRRLFGDAKVDELAQPSPPFSLT